MNVFVSQGVHEKLLERRTRLRETHERLIEDELMKMERELQEEQVRADEQEDLKRAVLIMWLPPSRPQVSGVEGEMSYLRRERHILVLQIEALRRENQQAYVDLEDQNQHHQQEVHELREESLQVTTRDIYGF